MQWFRVYRVHGSLQESGAQSGLNRWPFVTSQLESFRNSGICLIWGGEGEVVL